MKTKQEYTLRSKGNSRELSWLERQSRRVLLCCRCPRLRSFCEKISREKRAAFRSENYHAKPVPNFGDANARLLIVGLAPGAHGSNRTGRMFTGDRSGQWLYKALYDTGFAPQPTWESPNDGLVLQDCLITAICRCAPPKNKPLLSEIENCSEYLIETLKKTPWKVIVALGALAYREVGKRLQVKLSRFTHCAENILPDGRVIIASYHPSQQNTFTGKLTAEMLKEVFIRAKRHL